MGAEGWDSSCRKQTRNLSDGLSGNQFKSLHQQQKKGLNLLFFFFLLSTAVLCSGRYLKMFNFNEGLIQPFLSQLHAFKNHQSLEWLGKKF